MYWFLYVSDLRHERLNKQLRQFSKFPLKPSKKIKKRLQHRCFPVNIAKFLRALVLKNICEQLLLTPFCNVCKVMAPVKHRSRHLLVQSQQSKHQNVSEICLKLTKKAPEPCL